MDSGEKGYEGVLSRQALDVLKRRQLHDGVVRHAAVLLRVDHWLQACVDRGQELFQSLLLANLLQTAQLLVCVRIVIRHGFSGLQGREIICLLLFILASCNVPARR